MTACWGSCAMSTSTSANPHLEHLHVIGALVARQSKRYPPAVREEATRELLRYRDQGLIIQKFGKERPVAKKKKSDRAKADDKPLYSGQGIIFAIIDDREQLSSASERRGRVTTIDVIADAIEEALDNGHETSEEIARYLTTSSFQHVPDRRVRFNSVLRAGDVVGAHLLRKLYNAYNELEQLAEEEDDAAKKASIKDEARGFAEALTVVLSPFSVEDDKDPRLVDWDEVDRITDAFIKEQRFVRKERKGNPQ